MKKLLYKTAFFVVPFLALYAVSLTFSSPNKGDMSRLGYLLNSDYDYRVLFKEEFTHPKEFVNISQINLDTINHFDVMTVGDSFSEQENIGYQNYLANLSGNKVLHFDRFLHKNPLETLNSILNGDVLSKVKVKYIILQSVERSFIKRGKKVRKSDTIYIDWIQKRTQEIKKEKAVAAKQQDFFTKAIFRFPLYSVYYNFDDNAFFSPVYRVKTKTNLFSVNSKDLLFFNEDLDILETDNTRELFVNLNNEINLVANSLKAKGITLIVLPCPDKLDFYYDEIIEKDKYTKPQFFNYLETVPKDYLYINSKKLLLENKKGKKDFYFYDDTHWSPVSSKIIAAELDKMISKN